MNAFKPSHDFPVRPKYAVAIETLYRGELALNKILRFYRESNPGTLEYCCVQVLVVICGGGEGVALCCAWGMTSPSHSPVAGLTLSAAKYNRKYKLNATTSIFDYDT